MSKAITIPLEVLDKEIRVDIFKSSMLLLNKDKVAQNVIDAWPGVYCFYDNKTIYIGESVHPFCRLKEHQYNNNLKDNDNLFVFRSEQFHKSAIYDIETRLIDLFGSERLKTLRNDKLNQGNYNYFLKYAYAEVLEKIWSFLKEQDLTVKSISEIEETQIFKFSPYKTLNSDQWESFNYIKKNIKNNINELIVIEGFPGTGKSIVASRLFQTLSKEKKVCLTSGTHAIVNSFKKVFKYQLKINKTSSKILKTSQLLKSNEDFNIIIVDEAHRLLKDSGKSHNNKFAHVTKGSNELEMIIKKAKTTIILYDKHQSIHSTDMIFDFSKYPKRKTFALNQQMRSMNGFEYINWTIKWLSNNFQHISTTNKYNVKVFDTFSEMYYKLKEKSKKYKLTRLVSGYTRKWISKADSSLYDFNIEGIKLKWNNWNNVSKNKWMNSDAAKNLEEVTYYNIIQGFDLHYAGIIIGKDIYLDENDQIQINEDFVVAVNDKPKNDDPRKQEKLKMWVLNRYKILLSRGCKGAYIFIEDERLRKKIQSLIN